MIKEVFRNFGQDCIYFNFVKDGHFKTLENKSDIRVVISDKKENTILLIDRYLNGINPKNDDILYLSKQLYKIKNITKGIDGTYSTTIEKYKEK